ncbi:MAG: FmdB family zinc ribbon protein [Thermoanaerobaculia bacterium]
MPLYEYECAKCGERTEAIQRHGDALLTVCPHCGGALAKLLSAPAFQFKGSGWYVSDYGKSGEKKNGEAKPGDSSKGEEGVGAGGSAAPGAGAGESKKGDSSKDSPKGKKDGGVEAAPAPPAKPSAPAPSKKDSKGDPK